MTAHDTPIRRQYLAIKRQYPDVILFFRLGDFYETFDEDATLAAALLDITLTGREMGRGVRVPMAGIPYHAAEGYLARLVAAGHRVAIAEQVGAVTGRDLIHREVVRVVTPGTVVEPSMLDPTSNNYLAAVLVEPGGVGLAYADLSTGEFAVTQLPAADAEAALAAEMLRLRPREVLVPSDGETGRGGSADRRVGGDGGRGERESEARAEDAATRHAFAAGAHLTPLDGRHWRLDAAREGLLAHYEVAALDGFGCAGLPLAIRAAGALLHYAAETQRGRLAQIGALTTYQTGDTMPLDAQTIRNLELTVSSRGARQHSLLAVLDQTLTPLGARLLRRWLAAPLVRLAPLLRRQAAVAALVDAALLRGELRELLREISDLERLIGRVLHGSIGPRELATLARALRLTGRLRALVADHATAGADDADRAALATLAEGLGDLSPTADLIAAALVDGPPATVGAAPTIRPGFAPDLDALRASIRDSKDWLASLEARERERTGIRGLKVGFNKVFGYYLEVGHAGTGQVPADYIRKQTLVGAERYITPELKEHEARVLSAEEQIQAVEAAIYAQIVAQVAPAAAAIGAAAAAVARLDAAAALAEVAVRGRYVRPTLDEGETLEVVGARHPTVEAALGGEPFVPNDIHLSTDARQVVILTGPNMSGKSTYLRTVGLVALLAQIGAFVPAERAHVGLVDRIYTRVGAQDDIASGQSTFMVEMVETAAILHHATRRSLVILDEIGRGTSTYDGLAIARAVVEYLHHTPRLGCRTLFATHYHELTALAGLLPRAVNAKMDVLEEGDRVVFLRRVVEGGADRSYGLHVAGLAGIPRAVIRRAGEILKELESDAPEPERRRGRAARAAAAARPDEAITLQLSFLSAPHPVVESLRALDLDSLSPFEAMTRLYELKRMAGEGG